jgi:Tol biopolymer transport system component
MAQQACLTDGAQPFATGNRKPRFDNGTQMSERTEKILWAFMAVIAAGLALATAFLSVETWRAHTAKSGASHHIAFTYFQEQSGFPQIYTCDLESGDIAPLPASQTGDVFPIGAPLLSDGKALIAVLRLQTSPGNTGTTEIGTPGSVCILQDGQQGAGSDCTETVQRVLTVAPAWSPDGKQLAFAAVEDVNGNGEYQMEEAGIYVWSVDSANTRRVSSVQATGLRMLWSPVTSQLLLQVKKADVPVPVAHLLDLTSGELISRDDATTIACWSPDGQHIAAYSLSDQKIHVLRLDDGEEEYALDAPGAYVVELLWLPAVWPQDSADAGRLLAVSASQPHSDRSGGQLYVRSALPGNDQAWRRLNEAETEVSYPVASPDGRYVVYTLFSGQGAQSGADLWLLDLSNEQSRPLTSDPSFEGLATWIVTE